MVVRAGIVGVNFAVMMGLAYALGLDAFGRLALWWSIALVAGTAFSLGGPLILLRGMTDGSGIHFAGILRVAVIYPAMLAALGYGPLQVMWPALPWLTLVAVALGVNLLSCLASVLRGLGNVQGSMILRDAGPHLALGAALLLRPGDVLAGFATAALLMALAAGLAMLRITLPQGDAQRAWPRDAGPLWGASMLGVGVAQADLIVGGLFLPPEVFGLYAILRRVANLIALPVTVATWVSAAPISAAFGAGDVQGLQRASAGGSRIAVLSGGVIFTATIMALALAPLVVTPAQLHIAQGVLALLALGGFVQVWFASGFTVATLCGFARYAALARLAMVGLYLAAAFALGPALTAFANAAIYLGATSIGSVALWWALRRAVGVDTSAAVLLQGRVARWRTS
jgi:O-antigen/teichoic acid export membrane protein